MTSPISRLARWLNNYVIQCADEDGVAKDALFLAETYPRIKAVLSDAEEREIRDESVKLWLCELKYLAADAEDLLEEYEYDLKIKEEDEKEKYIQSTTLQDELSKRIRTIRERFDDISERREAFKLRKDDGDSRPKTPLIEPQPGHLANEPIMYGRVDDKKNLVDLLKNEHVEVVIGLVGVGGIGKTTLAQAVYNDVQINHHFDCKAWVTVSETFDVMRITKDILESLTMETSNFTELSVIQEELIRQLQGKKFFLVLNDLWEGNSYDLRFLKQMGLVGSKILITTRIKPVVGTMWPSKIIDLNPLSEQDGWDLFRSHAFRGTSEDNVAPNLVEIGKKIVKKCKGLPLLLRVLGDDLRGENARKRWIEILNHQRNDDVMKILMLSYHHLPRKLRQCFLYCSVFPKGYKFDMDELARLWAAHGLIKTEGLGHVEEIGKEYVNGLLQRSFIQQYTIHSDITRCMFSLHDAMHDLAQHILRNDQSLIKDRANTLDLHRALLVEASQKLRCYYEPVAGRTFIHSLTLSEHLVTIDMLTQHLKRLRVLILADLNLHDIPDSIGDLKHLRYLCVHSPSLRRLPDSVSSLHNLQTLECRSLEKLPQGMRRLKKLQHLLVDIEKFPPWIGELVELQTLLTFRVLEGGDSECARLSTLKDLSRLGGKFQITGLNNVDKAEEAKLLSLSNKRNLKHLFLNWDGTLHYDMQSRYMSFLVLRNLKPHDNLEELNIYNYVYASFPDWLESPSFARLTTVSLYYCSNCVVVPAFGQLPFLTKLYLKNMDCLECIGPEFYGTSPSDAFPSLRLLNLNSMDRLREWWGMDKCPFPQLSHLYLNHCHSLRFPVDSVDILPPPPATATLYCLVPVDSVDILPPPSLKRMFNTVRVMDVEACPHVEDWCLDHTSITLANVKDLTVKGKSYFGRRGGEPFSEFSKKYSSETESSLPTPGTRKKKTGRGHRFELRSWLWCMPQDR